MGVYVVRKIISEVYYFGVALTMVVESIFLEF